MRYADDFLVFARNPYEVEWYVMPKLQRFLATRGLALSGAKTRITTRSAGFNFLGFAVRQIWSKYSKILLITPRKENVKRVLSRIKTIITGNKQATVEHLIKLLNPVILGWAHYYAHCHAKRTFGKLDTRIFQMLWRWCLRRHPTKGRRWVKARYFKTVGKRHWVFGTGPACRLAKAADVHITPHVKVRGYSSPLDPALHECWSQRAREAIRNRYASPKKCAILWSQDYRCRACGTLFQEEDSVHFHHRTPRKSGGTNCKANLCAVHQRCHAMLHKRSDHSLTRGNTHGEGHGDV